jgi:formamidopyrimidine-DNA glycosylase
MPELPEVETVVRGLKKTVIGRTIKAVTLRAPSASITVSRSLSGDFAQALVGRTIREITRRGKNILIALSGDLILWVHLKMTGHFFWLAPGEPVGKHDLVLFDFESDCSPESSYQLRFNDYRRFGRLRLYYSDELPDQKGMRELGPEPLEISPSAFVDLCARRPRALKAALLDQSFLAGIGNIYADESLHAAGLHPRRLTTSVSRAKLIELHGHIQRLLRRAIRLAGTSVDSYTGVNGQPGQFQKYLLVYNNEGRPCKKCGRSIVREKIGSRSAHYCPNCQKKPRGR